MAAGQQGMSTIANAAQGYQGINPNIFANQQTLGTQQGLLNTALGRIQNGGLNAADLGRLNSIRASQAQQTNAGQAAAMSKAQQMGMLQGNSGILGNLVAGQQAANTASNAGMQANQQALGESNAMLGQGSTMANQLQGQNLGIQNQNFANQMNLQGGKMGAAYGMANALNNQGTQIGNTAIAAGGIGNALMNQSNSPNWASYTGSTSSNGASAPPLPGDEFNSYPG